MTKIRSNDDSMIDDRRGQSGGGGGGGGFPGLPGGLSGLPMGMKAGGGVVGMIIAIVIAVIASSGGGGGTSTNLSGGTVAGGGSDNSSSNGATCGTDLEKTLCGATLDVQTYWKTALPKFFSTNYPTTKTVFFSGRTNTGCGAASSQTGPFYCPLDKLVYFDLDFLLDLQKRFVGKSSDLAEQYIVAHEFGHHIQNVLGTNAKVNKIQQSKPSLANQYSVKLELQADCYAGVWVGDADQRGQLDSPDEIKEALAAAAGVGDDRIQQATQGRVNPESFTHGTSQQRQDWFMKGYNTMDPRQCDTFNGTL